MLSFAEFSAAFEEHAKRKNPRANIQKEGDGQYSLLDESGARVAISLGNAYKLYGAAPEGITSLFDLVLVLSEPVGAVSSNQLVAMVREYGTLQEAAAITREFAPGLIVAVAADLGNRFIFPTAEALSASGISAQDAISHAMSNIDRAVGQVSMNEHPAGFRVFGSSNDIGSSLILSEPFLGAIGGQTAGEPVFIIVGRNFLVVGDTANPEGVRAMCHLAKSVEPGPHPISSTPIIRKNGEWVTFELS